ncbi:MAG: hypothetical protein K8S14_09635, partial [Actinomycetia bacterium]|nr:hypothetical protein [Actinomycetes bacterium]
PHKSIILDRFECISTTTNEGYTSYRLNFPSIYQDITFYNWYQAGIYDLSSCVYFVSNDNYDEVAAAITNLGYPVNTSQGVLIFSQLPISIFAFIPAFMLVASICFYALSGGKKNVLKKMEGYTTRNIIIDELKYNAPAFLISFLIIETITLAAAAFFFKWAVFQYSIFSLKYILICLLVLFAGFIVAALLIYIQNSAEHIKGKVPKKGIYLISILSKCIFLVFIMYLMTISLNVVLICYNTYRTANFLKEKVSGYVTIPLYESNASSSNLFDNYLSFYNETVDNYNGILIDASNYRYSLMTGSTSCEKYGEDSITVNDNYLSFNPIYDTNGKIITPDSFSDGKFNILIPETKIDEMDKYRKQIQKWCSLNINFITYDADKTDIYSYNARTGTGECGRIDEPVILIADSNWLSDHAFYVVNWCSSGSYFIKTYTDDPYSELLPLLKETGIASVTPRTPYVSSEFDETINNLLPGLRLYGTQSIALLIGLVAIVLFSAKLYCENYRDRITYCLIEGYSLPGCIKSHLILTIISYILVLIIALFIMKNFTGISTNFYILAGAFIGEIIITFIVCRKYTRINLYEIVKGAE